MDPSIRSRTHANVWRIWRRNPVTLIAYGVLPWVIGLGLSAWPVSRGQAGGVMALPIWVLGSTLLVSRFVDGAVCRHHAMTATPNPLPRLVLMLSGTGIAMWFMLAFGSIVVAADRVSTFSTLLLIYVFFGFWFPLIISALTTPYVALLLNRSYADVRPRIEVLSETWRTVLPYRMFVAIYVLALVATLMNVGLPGSGLLIIAPLHAYLLTLAVCVVHLVESEIAPVSTPQ